jgi:hypothetical protein
MQRALSYEEKLAYLAAFIDGEGSVFWKPNLQRPCRLVGFTNTDKELFDFVCAIFYDLGFRLYIKVKPSSNPKHNTKYDAILRGGKEAYKRFGKIVPLQHRGKRERIEAMIQDYQEVESMGRIRRHYRKSRWTDKSPEERAAHAKYMRSTKRPRSSEAPFPPRRNSRTSVSTTLPSSS